MAVNRFDSARHAGLKIPSQHELGKPKREEKKAAALKGVIETARPLSGLNTTIPADTASRAISRRAAELKGETRVLIDGAALPAAFTNKPKDGSEKVDALTVCERQSRAVIESMGAMGDLEEELIGEAGFHIEKVSPITYQAHAKRAADAEIWGE